MVLRFSSLVALAFLGLACGDDAAAPDGDAGMDGAVAFLDAALLLDGAVAMDAEADGSEPSTGPDGSIEPLTGRLTAFVIQGLDFETPTQSGTTDADGTFRYLPGETVRFAVGDVAIGELAAQPLVTLFDIAGSEPFVGNWTIERALLDDHTFQARNVPFQRLVNLATFFQSIDSDGDGENGVEVLPELAELFQGASVDFDASIEGFHYGALNRAVVSAQAIFSAAHPVAHPALAMDALYNAAGVDPSLYDISRVETELPIGAAGVIQFSYDDEGRISRRVEGEDTIDYVFDEFGYLVSSTPGETLTRDVAGNILEFQTPYRHYVYTRNLDGRLVRSEDLTTEDGAFLYNYDAMGRLESSSNTISEGEIDYTYDEAGNLVRIVVSGEDGPIRITTNEYDDQDRQVSLLIDRIGRFTSYTEIEYDEAGNQIRRVRIHSNGMEGDDTRWEYEDGRLLFWTTSTSSFTVTYDERGYRVEDVSRNSEGEVRWERRYVVDSVGNETEVERIGGGVVTERARKTFARSGWHSVLRQTPRNYYGSR